MPPRAMEALVGLLTPPACREHVLGDLCERYRSPFQYFADALSTVPFVILSRIRRTTDPEFGLMQALALYGSFLAGAWGSDVLLAPSAWWRMAIPAVVALVVFVLWDAYATRPRNALLAVFKATVVAVGCVFLVHGILTSRNAMIGLPIAVLLRGGGLAALIVSALRLFLPGAATVILLSPEGPHRVDRRPPNRGAVLVSVCLLAAAVCVWALWMR
ncbi:MAG TPA: hypothetical protein VGF59_32600 [Bryobacteraceae bacterium]